MRIAVRGRNTAVTDTLRRHVEERFTTRIGKQVSDLAEVPGGDNHWIATAKVIGADGVRRA